MIDQEAFSEQQCPKNSQILQELSKPTRSKSKRTSRKLSGKRSKKRKDRQADNEYENKKCEYCRGQQDQDKILLCDRCDDSYHAYCLKNPLDKVPQKVWICQICVVQLQQLQAAKQRQKASRVIEKDCYLCKQPLIAPALLKGIDKQGRHQQVGLKNFDNFKCLYCKHTFHNHCFSHRKNSLNCWNCQKYIRKNGPKCHDDFMNWIENNIKSVQNSQCPFSPIINLQDDSNIKRHRCFRLKVPNYMTTWQSIAQNQASIYYSFKTKGLTFIDDQLYEKKDFDYMMSMNLPQKDINGTIMRLHQNDQSTYQLFKINSKKGYVGPFEVKQDRVKGFYLIASEFIQANTIISEYVGEVKTKRNSVNFEQNDSIFILIETARTMESLDIVPQLYGNISRFFLGINNKNSIYRGTSKLQNVKSLKFTYKGRVRLLLYTSKPIQSGETLYFNYNGSNYEYPTEHFVV